MRRASACLLLALGLLWAVHADTGSAVGALDGLLSPESPGKPRLAGTADQSSSQAGSGDDGLGQSTAQAGIGGSALGQSSDQAGGGGSGLAQVLSTEADSASDIAWQLGGGGDDSGGGDVKLEVKTVPKKKKGRSRGSRNTGVLTSGGGLGASQVADQGAAGAADSSVQGTDGQVAAASIPGMDSSALPARQLRQAAAGAGAAARGRRLAQGDPRVDHFAYGGYGAGATGMLPTSTGQGQGGPAGGRRRLAQASPNPTLPAGPDALDAPGLPNLSPFAPGARANPTTKGASANPTHPAAASRPSPAAS